MQSANGIVGVGSGGFEAAGTSTFTKSFAS